MTMPNLTNLSVFLMQLMSFGMLVLFAVEVFVRSVVLTWQTIRKLWMEGR